jgi:hypothetical protein
MLINNEPIVMWISFIYFVDWIKTFLMWITNQFWWFKILTPCYVYIYSCVFMHVVIFMIIMFRLGFLCVTSEYIFLNHQKWYLVLWCVIIRFNFVSIGFCNFCFALELLFEHQMVEYCFSFWFVFISICKYLNPSGAYVFKV